MKKKLFVFAAYLSILPSVATAQWSGSAPGPVFYNSGGVGIGTTVPAYTLQVGTIWNDLGANYQLAVGGDIAIGNTNPGSQPMLTIQEGTTGASVRIKKYNGYTIFSDDQGTINLNSNVGIGTSNPTGRLTLAGTGNLNPNPGSEVDYNGLNLTFRTESGNGFDLGRIKMTQPTGAFLDAADMIFQTSLGSMSEKMRITSGGNVSIGTADAKGYKLAVNGAAIATSMTVKLYANWPDFVFNPTYKLPTLNEVKVYINQNQHLPEIPSEAEVKKDGIDLGEMNKLLVKKVEELTLYLIQECDERKKQQQQIDQLKQRLDALDREIYKN